MPGHNSNYSNAKLDRCEKFLMTQAHLGYILLVFIIEVVSMTRFYYIFPHLRFGVESIGLTLFCIFIDVMIVKGIYKTKDSDPGYLIPPPVVKVTSEKTNTTSCIKCGYERKHSKIHHCSRCNRCVEYMDHHCVFTDNCIGKKNMKYFFHFVGWIEVALCTAFFFLVFNIYVRNPEH